MPTIGVTRGIATWKFQDNYVERVMDNAAYTAAHPDDTLVVAGPARTPAYGTNARAVESNFLAIGHLQTVTFSQQKPTQPAMAIGSGRTFFLSGKAQGQASLGRLFVNGRNLMRVLYHNVRTSQLDVTKFDDRPANDAKAQYYINLDSELYLIPFGLGVLFRDKIHQNIGGFYSELSMITSYNIGFNAGQNMIMEQTSLVFDRLLPFFDNYLVPYGLESADLTTLNEIMGFIDNTTQEAELVDGLTAPMFQSISYV